MEMEMFINATLAKHRPVQGDPKLRLLTKP
jgi:hypothetical protein